jgi:tetrahydromethanopterin S-methyltransferase subunit B
MKTNDQLAIEAAEEVISTVMNATVRRVMVVYHAATIAEKYAPVFERIAELEAAGLDLFNRLDKTINVLVKQRERIAELEAALKPFVPSEAILVNLKDYEDHEGYPYGTDYSVGDYRAAAKALEEKSC